MDFIEYRLLRTPLLLDEVDSSSTLVANVSVFRYLDSNKGSDSKSPRREVDRKGTGADMSEYGGGLRRVLRRVAEGV